MSFYVSFENDKKNRKLGIILQFENVRTDEGIMNLNTERENQIQIETLSLKDQLGDFLSLDQGEKFYSTKR